MSGEQTKEGGFERIFHDSGIEFANFDAKQKNFDTNRNNLILDMEKSNLLPQSPSAIMDSMSINQNEIQARLVLASQMTSSYNI